MSQDSHANGSHAEDGATSYLLNRGLQFPGDLPDWNLVPNASTQSQSYRQHQRSEQEEGSPEEAQASLREASSEEEEEETLKQRCDLIHESARQESSGFFKEVLRDASVLHIPPVVQKCISLLRNRDRCLSKTA